VVNSTKRYSHGGLDYRAPKGTPVRAINDAIVALSEEQWTPGQAICLDHGGGIFSKYIHLSERRVREGDAVTRGQIIALSGNTGGQKPPPHLHMDMVVNGTHVDPKDFINTAAQLLAL
jgi:murein DD-endopeptidase MepM/ murein hydrolase activator NlpD